MAPTLMTILALGILLVPLATDAQQPGKVPTIGVLWFADPVTNAPYLNAFREGLRELGYAEGRNVAVEYRFAGGNRNVLTTHAAELVRLRVDVIFVGGSATLEAARRATKTIPIVMASFNDPVGEGLVASLARPGGNITGLSWLSPELSEKRLELLKEVSQRVSRVAVLVDQSDSSAALELRGLQTAAHALDVRLHIFDVRNADGFASAFAAIEKAHPDALVAVDNLLTTTNRTQIADFALKNRLPLISEGRAFADSGALMTYGPRGYDMFKRAAMYVDRIFRGAKPGDLPIEQPTRFELVINLKTAKALGVTIPQSVLLRADDVIR